MQENFHGLARRVNKVAYQIEHMHLLTSETSSDHEEQELDENTVAQFLDLCTCFESEDLDSVWMSICEISQAISEYPLLISHIPISASIIFLAESLEREDRYEIGLSMLYQVSKYLYRTKGDFEPYVSIVSVDSSICKFLHEPVPLQAAITAVDILTMMAGSGNETVIGSIRRVGVLRLLCSMLNYFCPIKADAETPEGDLTLPYTSYKDESETYQLCFSILNFFYEFMACGKDMDTTRLEPVLKYVMAISVQGMNDDITRLSLHVLAAATTINFDLFYKCWSTMSFMRPLIRFASDEKYTKVALAILQNILYNVRKMDDIMALLNGGVMKAILAAIASPDEPVRIRAYMCLRNISIDHLEIAEKCVQCDGLLEQLNSQFQISSYTEKVALAETLYGLLFKGDLLWVILDTVDIARICAEMLMSMDLSSVSLAIDVLHYILHRAITEDRGIDAIKERLSQEEIPEQLEAAQDEANPVQYAEIQSILEYFRV